MIIVRLCCREREVGGVRGCVMEGVWWCGVWLSGGVVGGSMCGCVCGEVFGEGVYCHVRFMFGQLLYSSH